MSAEHACPEAASRSLLDPDLERLRSAMGLCAAVDARLTALGESGLGPPHQPCTGEEAVLVGGVAAMEPCDWVFWGRQVLTAALWRDLPLERLLRHALRGEAAQEIAERRIVACTSGPAARLSHAAGLGWAARGDGVVALCELGDGAIADGDFHVGVNFAAVLRAPVVFLVRSGTERPVADRAEGYGIRAVTIDGRCPTTVRAAVAEAASRARAGEGPEIVEAKVVRGRSVVPEHSRIAYEQAVERALAEATR